MGAYMRKIESGRPVWEGYLVTLVAVAIAALIASRLDQALNTLNISLIYLFVVLVAATYYGYGPAIMASVLGVLSFFFEFYPPYGLNGDLQVEDWLTLVFFVAFSVATSRLASSARARAAEAQARQRQLALLQQLGDSLRIGNDLSALIEAVANRLRETFGLRGCTVSVHDIAGAGIPASSIGVGICSGAGPVHIPLRSGERIIGALRLDPDPTLAPLTADDLAALATFGEQAAVAIERTALAAAAHQTAVFREADRLKTSLLRLISHDLRTPLATIKARASNVLEGDIAVESAELWESIRAIDAEADRLERLVAEVLELSRIEAGALTLRKEPYTADEVVSAVLPHLESSACGHRLVVDVPEDLPAVDLDIALISRVLANLLENAFKYAPAGTVVHLSAAAGDGGLLLRVADEGPGIPPALRERIFDAFYRVERSPGHGTPGVGLGLAVCRGLVAAHGGWIRVEDAEGPGAAFLVWLPGCPATAASAIGPASGSAPVAAHLVTGAVGT